MDAKWVTMKVMDACLSFDSAYFIKLALKFKYVTYSKAFEVLDGAGGRGLIEFSFDLPDYPGVLKGLGG